MQPYNKKIVLENGKEFYGYGFGADKEAINEIVFNTSMVGYQEIVSDPSYTDQMVCMTYPLIGNYGMTDEDYETKVPTMGGLIVREYNDLPSNFRYTKTLDEVLVEYDIPAISNMKVRIGWGQNGNSDIPAYSTIDSYMSNPNHSATQMYLMKKRLKKSGNMLFRLIWFHA